LTNNGTIEFAAAFALHTLTVSGSYTQGSSGTLSMRIAAGPAKRLPAGKNGQARGQNYLIF
jgi:hypothetical protein